MMIYTLFYAAAAVFSVTNLHAIETERKISAALYCAVSDGALPIMKQATSGYEVSSTEDLLSHPGIPHLILVVRGKNGKSEVFDFREERIGSTINFNLQNNATFHLKNGIVVFDAPPLGGFWRQIKLKNYIKAAIKSKALRISGRTLVPLRSTYACSSYS